MHVRFDERDVETGHGLDSEAPANERAGYRQAKPKPPPHISTLQVDDLKGTGFSPYVKSSKINGALAPEGMPAGFRRDSLDLRERN